ncbi:MAG: thioredoxin [Verrucomicrobiota bacterium]
MASEMVVNVSSSTFDAEVLKSTVPVVVDFWAPWCGPCRMIAPFLDDVSKKLDGKVKIAKVNVDEESALAAQYGVSSIPMILFFKNGEKQDQFIGAVPKEIQNRIDAMLK